jgi:hypothetical protein
MEAILLVLPMESLLYKPEVRSLPIRVRAQKGSNFFIRLLYLAQISTVVSGGRFPCCNMESLLG